MPASNASTTDRVMSRLEKAVLLADVIAGRVSDWYSAARKP